MPDCGVKRQASPHLTSHFIYSPTIGHSQLIHNMAPSRTSPIPSLPPQSGLSDGQLSTFETDGYLIIPSALDHRTVTTLLEETHSLINGFSLSDHPMTKFSTGEKSDHVGDDYFLDSGDKVRFFFEGILFFSSLIFSYPVPSAITPLYYSNTLV